MIKIIFLMLSVLLVSCAKPIHNSFKDRSNNTQQQNQTNDSAPVEVSGEDDSENFEVADGQEGDTSDGQDTDVVNFERVQKVFLNYCQSCHVKKGEDLTFENESVVQNYASLIFERVFIDEDMPPKKRPTDEELNLIKKWLETVED